MIVYWGSVFSTAEPFRVASGTTEFSSWGGTPTFAGSLTIEAGATFRADTGGGNGFAYNGPIQGTGTSVCNAGVGRLRVHPDQHRRHRRPTRSAARPSSNKGTLDLGKPAGVDAIAGPLNIGNGTANSHVRLNANEQINDAVVVTIASNSDLRLQGYSETIGGLVGNAGEGAVMNTTPRTPRR